MAIARNAVDLLKFNTATVFPFELRREDFQLAMQDAYDFFFDVNSHLLGKGLQRLDDMLRPAIMSGVLSDMLTASLAKHSRALDVRILLELGLHVAREEHRQQIRERHTP